MVVFSIARTMAVSVSLNGAPTAIDLGSTRCSAARSSSACACKVMSSTARPTDRCGSEEGLERKHATARLAADLTERNLPDGGPTHGDIAEKRRKYDAFRQRKHFVHGLSDVRRERGSKRALCRRIESRQPECTRVAHMHGFPHHEPDLNVLNDVRV